MVHLKAVQPVVDLLRHLLNVLRANFRRNGFSVCAIRINIYRLQIDASAIAANQLLVCDGRYRVDGLPIGVLGGRFDFL